MQFGWSGENIHFQTGLDKLCTRLRYAQVAREKVSINAKLQLMHNCFWDTQNFEQLLIPS